MVNELLYTAQKVIVRQIVEAMHLCLELDKFLVDVFHMTDLFCVEGRVRMVAQQHAGSDHHPQVKWVNDTTRQTSTSPAPATQPGPPQGYSWKLMDRDLVAAEAALLRTPRQIRTAEDLETETEALAQQLSRIGEVATPRRKPGNGKASPWWSAAVRQSVAETRKTARAYRATRTIATYMAYCEASEKQRHIIETSQRAAWRNYLHEASRDPKKIWSLARWSAS